MDEEQVNKLGSKMKQVYADVVEDPGGEVATQASRGLRTTRNSARSAARGGSDTLDAQIVAFVRERPIVALVAAAGVGYLMSRVAGR